MRFGSVLFPMVVVGMLTGGAATMIGTSNDALSLASISDDDTQNPATNSPSRGPSGPMLRGAVGSSGAFNEPSIAISPDGRIFVTAIQGVGSTALRSPIWEYLPAQDNWVRRGVSLHRTAEIGGGDADLEIDSAGRFYHTDLWLGSDGMAVSEDGVNWIGTPVGHYVTGNDRQWMAHYDDKYLYMITNHLVAGGVSFRYEIGELGYLGGLMAPVETPMRCQCGPPGFPSVNQNTGHLFVPMQAPPLATAVILIIGPGEGLFVFRSMNDGLTFTGIRVHGAGSPVGFPVSAVDEAGNVYVAWGEVKNGRHDIWMTVSTTNGNTYRAPVRITNSGTNVFPWMVAGEDGKIAVGWYGTDTSGDPNTLPASTQWKLKYAQSLNAASGSPTFTQWDWSGVMHHGTISTNGLLGNADRSLGDFFSMELDPTTGTVYSAFINNAPSTPANQRGVWVEAMPAGASALT